jgi:hypothetical protein
VISLKIPAYLTAIFRVRTYSWKTLLNLERYGIHKAVHPAYQGVAITLFRTESRNDVDILYFAGLSMIGLWRTIPDKGNPGVEIERQRRVKTSLANSTRRSVLKPSKGSMIIY